MKSSIIKCPQRIIVRKISLDCRFITNSTSRPRTAIQRFTVCFGSHFYYSCTINSLGMIHVQSFTCCKAGPLSVFIPIVFYAMPWQTGGIFAPACWDAVLGQGKFCPCSLAQCVSVRKVSACQQDARRARTSCVVMSQPRALSLAASRLPSQPGALRCAALEPRAEPVWSSAPRRVIAAC